MPKINPNASKLIDEYIYCREPFAEEICSTLRTLIHTAENEIIEDWKWRIPVFHKKTMVCGFAAFKNHVSLTFFNGANMSDKHHLFSEDCSAQHTRTIKFLKDSELDKNALLDYFKEAFLIDETSVKKKTSTKTEIEIPKLLQQALQQNEIAKTNFENMAYTYRKEYALHIANAKREATKFKRLEKVISNLEKNIKMHEQYKC